jgi:hypothetical protein
MASKAEDSVKGQMYNKAEGGTHFSRELVLTSFSLSLSLLHTRTQKQ